MIRLQRSGPRWRLAHQPSVRLILRGGLGNQLFQYYYAVRVAHVLGMQLEVDVSGPSHQASRPAQILEFDVLGRILGTPTRHLPRAASRRVQDGRRFLTQAAWLVTGRGKILDQDIVGVGNQALGPNQTLVLKGYYQSHSSVEATDAIGLGLQLPTREELQPPVRLASEARNAIGVHVRLGDYCQLPSLGVLPGNYYRTALERLRDEGERGPVLLFSDEPETAADLVPFADEVIRLGSPIAELALMNQCRSHIISNSTFAWWGTRWAESDGQVVAPWPWFRTARAPAGILSPDWITLNPW